MGTTCGCSNMSETNAPQPVVFPEKPSSTTRRSNKKFQDINPQQQLYICLSEQDLNLFKNEISERINEYELKNGVITKRIPFENQQFTQRNPFQIQFSSRMITKLPLNQQQAILVGQAQRPITEDNIRCEIQQQQSQSNYQSQRDDSSEKSCLLSQQTNILNASLFTERLKATQIFYSQFRYFGQVELLEWDQQYRKSYFIYQSQLKKLILQNVDSKYIVLLRSIQKYQVSHGIHLLSFSHHPKGVKLHLNGKKRLFPMKFNQNQLPTLSQLYRNVRSFAQKTQITHLTYFLTGWIPQVLNMAEISNFQGIFQRLSSNMQEGNTLISFSKRNHNDQVEYVSLRELNVASGLITLNIDSKNVTIPSTLIEQKPRDNQLVMTFQNFVQIFDTIHLNWNPVIYQTIVKRQGIIKSSEQRQTQFVLIIPPSSQDIEVRLFIQKHHNFSQGENPPKKLIIELFQFQEKNAQDAIRTVQIEDNICSDVFIFQTCKEKTKYLLNIKTQQDTQLNEDLYFSVTMLSFVEMHFDCLDQAPLVKEISCNAVIDPKNVGFGINSPYFDTNLQFSIQTQKQKELRVEVKASNKIKYEICLIPDVGGDQCLSKINLENIINKAEVSSLKRGVGNFTIKSHESRYLMVLNCFAAIHENIEITLQLRGRQPQNQDASLRIREVRPANNVIFVQQLKWLPNHSGPRKRLKSNSNSQYQPAQTFSEFFKNPIIEKHLPKGKYQFFVKSQTFKEYFDSVQTYQDKNMCEPPPLSIAVLEANKEKKQYRIISDDAFYIPFGLGFWSQEIELQEGYYRFVCAKIQKSYALGTFGIVKC